MLTLQKRMNGASGKPLDSSARKGCTELAISNLQVAVSHPTAEQAAELFPTPFSPLLPRVCGA